MEQPTLRNTGASTILKAEQSKPFKNVAFSIVIYMTMHVEPSRLLQHHNVERQIQAHPVPIHI